MKKPFSSRGQPLEIDMSHPLQKAFAPIVSYLSRLDPFAYLDRDKRALIDFAFQRFGLRSFADLGGVWNVAGGYTFYTLEKFGIEKAFLVDTDFTDEVHKRASSYPSLQLIQGNFGNTETIAEIGSVDAVMFFDTLLHQVNPDWDKVLELYASKAKHFLVFNQQFSASEHTVRLFDLGEEEYFRNVPHSRSEAPYNTLFQKLYEVHPQHQRIYRDIHNVWQWGITDDDLIVRMKQLGFTMQFYKNAGRFAQLENFENHAFLFSR